MSKIFQKPPFNYEYKVGVYNAADYSIDQNTATGVVVNQVLSSVFIPRGSFLREGQEIHIRAAGRSSGAGSKTLRLRLNTITIIQVTGITPINNSSWLFESVLRRRTSTTLYRSSKFLYNMGETAGSATPTILGNGGILTLSSGSLDTSDLLFDLEVDVAVAAETLRQDDMSVAIL